MHKLRLRVEELTVDTFPTDAQPRGVGTVLANSKQTMIGCLSGAYSCLGTCAPGCVTGHPDPCWISWDPAARCMIPP